MRVSDSESWPAVDHDGQVGAERDRGRERDTDDEIDELLHRTHSVAVVGVSSDSQRPSRRVAAYLIGATGWTVYLVNPNVDRVLGRDVYASLADLPEPPDIVDVFRRTEHLRTVTEQAIAVGAGAVWFQLGLKDPEAAELAIAAGLDVVQDRCLRVEHFRMTHTVKRS
jgi:predicted CoA-binding protein